MYCNIATSYDDCSKFQNIVKNYSMVFTPALNTLDTVTLIDEYSQRISSSKFNDTFCLYQYYYEDDPLYVGISTDGNRNRFKKNLRSIFVDKELNRKCPDKPLHMKGNARDTWIVKLHAYGLDLNKITLKVLPIDEKHLGHDNYFFLVDLANDYGFGVFERITLNSYIRNALVSYLLNSQVPHKYNNLFTTKSKTKFVKDVMSRTLTIENFMVA